MNLQIKSKLRKRILFGGFWLATIKAVFLPLSLLLISLLTRVLPPSEVANYFLCLSFVTTASSVGMLGIDQVMVRRVASAIPDGNLLAAQKSIYFAFIWSILGALSLTAFIPLFGPSLGLKQNFFFLTGLWILVQTIQNLLAEGFRSLQIIYFATIFQNRGIVNALMAIIVAFTIVFKTNTNLTTILVLIIVISATTNILGIIALWFELQRKYATNLHFFLPSLYTFTEGKHTFIEAVPILGFRLLNMVQLQIVTWSIATLLSAEDLALFGSALRLASVVSMPLISIVNALIPPIIAELFAQKKLKKLEHTVRNLATAATVASSLLALLMLVGGKFLLNFFFGAFYQNAQVVLAILTIGHLFDTASGSCGLVLIMTGHQKTLLKVTTLSTILVVTLTIILVSLYGILGAAIASTSGLIISNTLVMLSVNKRLGIRTFAKIIRI